MALAWLTGNTLAGGSTDLNTASGATALEYTTSQYFDDAYFTYDDAQPTRLVFTQAGDYLISAGLPMISNGVNTANRNDIVQELRLNGALIPGGYSDSSYIRNSGGAFESSNRSSTVVLGVSPGDYIEHIVYRGSTETTNTVTDQGHTLYAEFITGKTVFAARATQTTNSTNLNQYTAYPLRWSTEDRVDVGYTHDTGTNPQNITLDQTGRYLVYCNIPLSTSIQRGNITAKIILDGVQVSGGRFQQGMVRNSDGIDTGSCHYAGIVTTTTPGQVLTITTEQEAGSGTITVGSYYANVAIVKAWSDVGVYAAEATQVGGVDNWNPTTKSTINWATDNLIDTEYFSHNPASSNDEITINKDGDYFLVFNTAFTGTVTRAVPKATVQINGTNVPGLSGISGYIRNSGSADSSSDIIIGLMPELRIGDVITVSMEKNGASGTINDQTPASLMIRGKNLPVATTFWFTA